MKARKSRLLQNELNLKNKKDGSQLERLPLELLAEIFILSQNPLLLEASPALKRMLASRYLIYAFLANVIDEKPWVFPTGSRYRIDRSVLQQLVLCPWFTPAFLDEWLMRTKKVDLCTGSHYLAGCTCDKSIDLDYTGIELPLRALQPPWTSEQIELLSTLIAYGARISPSNYAAGQQALKAVYSALEDFKLEPLKYILAVGDPLEPFGSDILRYAVLQAPFSRRMILEILAWARTFSNSTEIDYSDGQLLIWAKRQQRIAKPGAQSRSIYPDSEPDDDGTWLLDTLKKEIFERSKRRRTLETVRGIPGYQMDLRMVLHQQCYRLRRSRFDALGEVDAYEPVY